MTSPGPEPNSKKEYVNPDEPYSKVKNDHVFLPPAEIPVWGGPPSGVIVPGAGPPPLQHGIHTLMVDPLSLGPYCLCQYPQGQVVDPQYLQSSQFNHLTGPAPGSSDSCRVGSLSSPWYKYEPVLCSMMPAVGHQQFQEKPAEFSSQYTQPLLFNVDRGAQDVMLNPSKYGPAFHTLEPKPTHRQDGVTPGRTRSPFTYNVDMLRTPGQYHRAPPPVYKSSGPSPSLPPQAPPRTVGNRKLCHCSRSQCLKLYCECFANGLMCHNCDCSNCFNNAEHLLIREKAMEIRSGRNPDAFRTKIIGGRSGEVKGWHKKGCSCKRSGCLKNYCECYEASVLCTSSCRCNGCNNFDDSSADEEKTIGDKNKCSQSVIAVDVVEAVCGCLLDEARKAEMEAQSSSQAERMILEEFGFCLAQIVEAMFK